MTRSRLLGANLALAAAALLLAAIGWADNPNPAKAPAKDIDLVLCLDCSNSMDGLIDSAKGRLWDIVNDFNKIKAPRPNLRVALYSYGNNTYDEKIGWVRKEVDLTADLDLVHKKLFELTTQGGEEYVARVCRDAVHDLKWTQQEGALKLIFVCGNEPASQDPKVTLKEVAEAALKRGIYINPIFCGDANDPDARDWKLFAGLTGGQFATIDQHSAKVALATPHDKELAELGVKLNETFVYYGALGKDKAEQQSSVTKAAYALSVSSAASCAAFRGSSLYKATDWDLVQKCKEDPKFDLAKVPAEQLCEKMRKMSAAQRQAYVKDMTAKREDLKKQIGALEAKRDAYLAEETKKQAAAAKAAPASPLAPAITESIRKQAEKKGFGY